MTSRCVIYWQLMIARDKASAAVVAARLAHPDGGGMHPQITYAEGVQHQAQRDETNHLHTCPVCGEWWKEIKIVAERPMEECKDE